MKQIGVLAVLFAVLLAAVIVKETSRPSAGSLRDQVPLQRLGPAAFEASDVDGIEIAGPGGADPFRIVRGGAVWVVEGAFRAPAAAGKVDELLGAVIAARGELRLDDAAAFAKFDLTDERASTVILRSAAGSVLAEFALGRSSGTQGAFVRPRFAGVRDGAYAVSQDLRGALGLARTRPGDAAPEAPRAEHFHDLNLPNLAVDGTARIELVSPLWTLAFAKTGADWAPVEGAPDLPVRSSGIAQIARTLGSAPSATALVDPARRAELGLDAAAHRVTAVLEDGSRRSAVGAADREGQKYYVRLDAEQDPDVVYECSRYTFERLFPPGSQLFEFTTLGVQEKTLGQVRIEGTTEPFAMQRAANDTNEPWTVVTPGWSLPPRAAQLRDYGVLLNGVRPIDWYAGDAPLEVESIVRWGGTDAPAAELTELRIGQAAPGGGGRLAVLPTDPDRIVVLADSVVQRLVPDLMTLFEPRPLSGAVPGDVTGVTVRTLSGDTAGDFEVRRDEDGAWRVLHGGTDDPGNANAIASWVDDLIGIEVVERGDGAAAPAVEIVVRRGATELTLGIGPEADGRRGLTVDGVPFVTDTPIDVPGAASLVGEEPARENPGDGAPAEQPGDTPGDDDSE